MPENVPRIVIDTQVVMDWMVFGEPSISALVAAVESGAVQWVGRAEMQAELRHVLARGVAADRAPDLVRIDAHFSRYCQMIAAAPPPAVTLICRDPDDQQFIDLAVAQSVRWLISRDRAVLALAKRARKLGPEIVTPKAWLAQWSAINVGVTGTI